VQLKKDQEAGKQFVGPDCPMCNDPDWAVKKKKIQ
jgi:hypothetical protein